MGLLVIYGDSLGPANSSWMIAQRYSMRLFVDNTHETKDFSNARPQRESGSALQKYWPGHKYLILALECKSN